MKVPKAEIVAVQTACQRIYSALKSAPRVNKDVPLTTISNPFGSFVWMKYTPSIQIGGSIQYAEGAHVRLVYTEDGKLAWRNQVQGGPGASWHQPNPDFEEVIAP
jgi:hypothetical protein